MTTVLPQAIAYGRNQNGIIPGKLNGAMIAHTPSGWRIIISSMPGGDVFGVVALNEDRRAARDLDVLDRAPHLAARLRERLAALHRDGAGEILELLLEQHLQLEQDTARAR